MCLTVSASNFLVILVETGFSTQTFFAESFADFEYLQKIVPFGRGCGCNLEGGADASPQQESSKGPREGIAREGAW